MIRFRCPRCQSLLETKDEKAGQKIYCPRCLQKLQIPVPPANKTVLAQFVSSTTDTAGIQAMPTSPSLPVADQPPPIIQLRPPRRRWRFSRRYVLIAGALLAIFALIYLTYVGLKSVLRDESQGHSNDLRMTIQFVGVSKKRRTTTDGALATRRTRRGS